jgi:hypothetical protein
LDATPKAKERNSGVIMDEISFGVQVQIVGAGEKLFSQATALVLEVPEAEVALPGIACPSEPAPGA